MPATRILFAVLVLLSTLRQAPDEVNQVQLSANCKFESSCHSEEQFLPCIKVFLSPGSRSLSLQPPTMLLISGHGQHSFLSEVSSDFHISLLFFDPVSVVSVTIEVFCVLGLLGMIAWGIVQSVWIVCTSVVSRINALPKKRTPHRNSLSPAILHLILQRKKVQHKTEPEIKVTDIKSDSELVSESENVKLMQMFVHLPSGETLTCSANNVEELKKEVFNKSGIPPQQQHLFCQNKLLSDNSALIDNSNIHLHIKVKGGSKECDICFSSGVFICNECNDQVFCDECCTRFHKHPKRMNHKPIKILHPENSDSITLPQSSTPPKVTGPDHTNIIPEESNEYAFSDSQSFNDTFEHAARIATLAEHFNLTKFKDFQSEVIDNTLAGKDSIVIQPTGSGKSLCYQFPPVYQNKKAVVICPTISLMNDQVAHLSSKGIKSTFLGSAQLDKDAEDRVFSRDSEEAVIFVTPEWISKPDKRYKVKELATNNMLSLIAIDEAHLYHEWQEFRKAYKDLEALKFEFPKVPIMALTATSPSEVTQSIKKLVRDPLISKASVNRPNIYLECEELPTSNDLSYFAQRVVEKIGNDCTIIYTDFINSVGPIMSHLSELNVDSVAYYGEMDVKSRNESYQKWKNGDVKVMVATSAFGMGIDKSDIKNIIRLGVPENMCSWAQELGRAGRGGDDATATVYFASSDMDHAGTWIRDHLHNTEYCSRILEEFSTSWQYVMAHLAGECRRKVFLKQFGEDIGNTEEMACCDVCSNKDSITYVDRKKELIIAVDAVNTIGMKGELKLAQWIRGSTLQWTADFNKLAISYGNGMGHSEQWWRRFLRQCSVNGVLKRELKSLIKRNSHYCIQALFFVSQRARDIVQNKETSFLVPDLDSDPAARSLSRRKRPSSDQSVGPSKKVCREGKGTHGLRIVKSLLEDSENWEVITSKDDYHYLGVFKKDVTQSSMYYIEDCTKLDQSCATDPHFLWHDVQLSKGKANKDYHISIDNAGQKEELVYRCAPCAGVKVCSEGDCNFAASISRLRSCPKHPKAELKRSNDLSVTKCPVEFVYIFPKDYKNDNRRWIMGYNRQQKFAAKNLHNHAIPHGTKMCALVKNTIQQSASINPQLKASQIAQGKGLPFVPGAVDTASTHIGRVAQQVKKGRVLASGGSYWDISDFEKVADSLDINDDKFCANTVEERESLKQMCRPYLTSAGIENNIKYVFTMNPLMCTLLSTSEFVEADVTFNDSIEYPYLFNMVAFDEVTMEWSVVSRIRMDKQGADAHALAFKKTFEACKLQHPDFRLGETLRGIVVDWSDSEIKGLGQAVGKDLASSLLRGCQVHWSRSWQRVRDRVCKSNDTVREKRVFSSIASKIPEINGGENVLKCFKALCGEVKVSSLKSIIPEINKEDAEYVDSHCNWTVAKNWAAWWIRPSHLQMLHKDYTLMEGDAWKACPNNTNAVERKNQDCKERVALPVRQRMCNMYKADKAFCAKHLAVKKGNNLTYHSRTTESRKKTAEKRSLQRKRASQLNKDSESQLGPPDKKQHFQEERKRKSRASTTVTVKDRIQALKNKVNTDISDSDDDFMDMSSSSSSSSSKSDTHSPDGIKLPDVKLIGRKLKMKFYVEDTKKHEYFDGKIVSYNGLEGKYGAYFPSDGEVVFIEPNDKDVTFLD